ncbi:uncharacterized protein BcabD6B2_21610 [Babesia caballi]|uniref:Uncharacterized protein n=1 Tax=Babesia caballi TaxID=5871 RepID=A0AAV4LUG8_BABCB|nr:hypothetical protein, conserved [Babesia caballi]
MVSGALVWLVSWPGCDCVLIFCDIVDDGGGAEETYRGAHRLKEAIDWVIQIKNDNGAIKGLAEEVIKLLDKDAGDVAREVLEVMGKSFDKVVGELRYTPGVSGYIPRYFVKQRKVGLQTVVDYGSAIETEKLEQFKQWLQKDVNSNNGPITQLAEKLKDLLGYNGSNGFSGNGLIKNGSGHYTSAYLENTTWSIVSESDKKSCALIFLGIAPMIFLFVAYLYWQCEGTGGNWKDMTHDSNSGSGSGKDDLKRFFDSIGYKDCKLNQQKKKGSDIASLMDSAFSKFNTAHQAAKTDNGNAYSQPAFFELESAKPAAKSYRAFLNELVMSARPASPSEYPLTCCHMIASTFFIANDTYIVEPTSPATPSFAGYSGLTALAGGAYGFNLGGLGTFMSALLA